MCRHCSTAAKVSRSLPASILECILEQGYMTLDEEEWQSPDKYPLAAHMSPSRVEKPQAN